MSELSVRVGDHVRLDRAWRRVVELRATPGHLWTHAARLDTGEELLICPGANYRVLRQLKHVDVEATGVRYETWAEVDATSFPPGTWLTVTWTDGTWFRLRVGTGIAVSWQVGFDADLVSRTLTDPQCKAARQILTCCDIPGWEHAAYARPGAAQQHLSRYRDD